MFSHAHEDHSNTYKTIPRSRLHPHNHSCYKQKKTALCIASTLVALHKAQSTVGLNSKLKLCNPYFRPLFLTILFHFHEAIRRIIKAWQYSKNIKLFISLNYTVYCSFELFIWCIFLYSIY